MSRAICQSCRTALRQQFLPTPKYFRSHNSTLAKPTALDIAALLAKPTWSVRSLLPDTSSTPDKSDAIAPKTLHHLLRLSALPLPTSPEQEAKLLETLEQQLHFVRAIQAVDTEGVEPLQAIRDETAEGEKERTIVLEDLKDALGKEDVVGRMKRPKRRKEALPSVDDGEKWDVLGTAGEVVENGNGRYFVVRSGKEKRDEEI